MRCFICFMCFIIIFNRRGARERVLSPSPFTKNGNVAWHQPKICFWKFCHFQHTKFSVLAPICCSYNARLLGHCWNRKTSFATLQKEARGMRVFFGGEIISGSEDELPTTIVHQLIWESFFLVTSTVLFFFGTPTPFLSCD